MDTIDAQPPEKDVIVEKNFAYLAAMVMREFITIKQDLQCLQGMKMTQVGAKILGRDVYSDQLEPPEFQTQPQW